MNFRTMRLHMSLAASLALTACTATGQGEKQFWGTVVGGVAGGLIGSEIGGRGDSGRVGAALGAVLGASLGNRIGKDLDRADRERLYRAQQEALESYPSGTRSEWYNPDSGNRGWVEPKPAYRAENGQYCREFTQTIYIGGKPEEGYGTACRQPDGSWKIVG